MTVNIHHCTPFLPPNLGEELAVAYLRQRLPSGVLLVNYYLPDPPGMLELDVVVVSQNGVYVLEVKHWWGKIESYPGYWRHVSSDEQRGNPTTEVAKKARVLHGRLQQKGFGNVSVVGLVVLTKGLSMLERSEDYPPEYARNEFAMDEHLIKALTGRDYVHHHHAPRLSSSEITRVADTLFHSYQEDDKKGKVAVQLFGHRVTDRQEQGHYANLTAEDMEMPGRKVRIKAYRLPEVASGKELQAAVKQFKRDMEALIRAGSHPNLVYPIKFWRDHRSDDGYFLILEWAGEQTLADRLAAGPVSTAEQWSILQQVAAALAHCHAHGVVHRNLSPASVYLAADGQVRVGDFDFARMPTVSRTITLRILDVQTSLLAGRHVSPEQKLDLHDVDKRADLYALGVLWYDMLFAPMPDAPLERERINESPLPPAGLKLLHTLVAESRAERVSSAAAVLQQLEALAASSRGYL
ncbi:MAG: NERD domain-containing protein [Ardenticatenaceae bacterium]|nr:NERD domain-containing protein [Ardenticatenaceae bacterium]